ncbi:MAG: hypothetical protein ACREJO_12040 [Phycisphaerales bacterium]
MPPTHHPPTARKRRLLGWTFLTSALLITLIFIVSRWCWSGYVSTNWSTWCSSGELTIATPAWNIFGGTGLQTKSAPSGASWSWRFAEPDPFDLAIPPIRDFNLGIARYRTFARGNTFFDILLWPPALAALLAGVTLLYSARRAERHASLGLCPNCRYNLAGLAPNTPCPECGSVSAARRAESQ